MSNGYWIMLYCSKDREVKYGKTEKQTQQHYSTIDAKTTKNTANGTVSLRQIRSLKLI